MKKVLLFGATGNAGAAIAGELKKQGYDLTVVVRNQAKANQLSGITSRYIIADITRPQALSHICDGFEVVVSALGKSVSLNDKSKASFYDIDYVANSAILTGALYSSVKKFVYVSALHAENYLHLAYCKAHHDFSEQLKQSGINYSIIKPPAIFSAFTDMIDMAKKGMLVNLGKGDKVTNPIYEGDLAKICVDAIRENNVTIEAGGQTVYTRKQLVEIIQQQVNAGKKVKTVPLGIIKIMLPLIMTFNKNMYDKFAFFIEIMQHDTIAPQIGKMKFEDYIKMKTAG